MVVIDLSSLGGVQMVAIRGYKLCEAGTKGSWLGSCPLPLNII